MTEYMRQAYILDQAHQAVVYQVSAPWVLASVIKLLHTHLVEPLMLH